MPNCVAFFVPLEAFVRSQGETVCPLFTHKVAGLSNADIHPLNEAYDHTTVSLATLPPGCFLQYNLLVIKEPSACFTMSAALFFVVHFISYKESAVCYCLFVSL